MLMMYMDYWASFFAVTIKRANSIELKKKSYAIVFLFNVFFLQKWEYMNIPKPNSEEEKIMKVLKEPRDWLNIEKSFGHTNRSAAWIYVVKPLLNI